MQQIDTRRSDESSGVRWRNIVTDTRGVSEVLGAILVFALVLAVLVLMQVAAVPAANQQVEFEHDQATQEDLQDVRTAIVEASASGEPRAASVRLGVRYPPRLFLLNPGPVAGTLRTTTGGAYAETGDNLDLEQICGTENLGTKHLLYTIDYNEYRGQSLSTVENTVVVQKYENSESPLVKNGQILVKGNTITLFIIKGNASHSGIQKESINFISGGTGTFEGEIDSDWSLTVPSTLDAEEWKTNSNLLESELDEPSAPDSPGRYVTSINDGVDDTVDIHFEGGKEYTVRCTVVGINEDPGTNPTDDIPPAESEEINPVGPNDLMLESVTRLPGQQSGFDANFHNNADNLTAVTAVRVAFVSRPGHCGSSPCEVTLDAEPFGSGVTVGVGQDFTAVNNPADWTWEADGTVGDEKIVRMTGQVLNTPDSELAVVFKFSDGSTSTYFIGEAT